MRSPSIQIVCCFILCFSVCTQIANGSMLEKLDKWSMNYYTAAVFEIAQVSIPDSKPETIKANLKLYETAARTASENDADIIVYPEKGLFPVKTHQDAWFLNYAENIPDPRTRKSNPCEQAMNFQDSPMLRNFSCLAKEYDLFLVATLIDVKECEVRDSCNENNINYCTTDASNCPEGGKFRFNTLVAFNNEGLLITRYHKRHPLLEKGITASKDPRPYYFDTDFGRFATYIGFDVFFGDIVESIKQSGATSFAYPNWWYDHTPLVYFSTPFKQAWSIANHVYILGSDVQDPPKGSEGSGNFAPGSGALIYSTNNDHRSKLLVSNVPISPSYDTGHLYALNQKFYYVEGESVKQLRGREPRNFGSQCQMNVLGNKSLTDYRCIQTDVQQYTFIKLTEKDGNIQHCSNGFCCSFTYKADSMNEDFYFGVSGSPFLLFDTFVLGVQGCFLARCESVDGKPCRNFILKSETVFRNADISGNFSATTQILPYAINSDIRLTDKNDWNFDGKSRIQYKNSNAKSSLLFFGLYGRKYDEDETLDNQNS